MSPFWRSCPALLYAIATLLGSALALSPTPSLLIPITLIVLSLLWSQERRLWFALLVGATSFLWAREQVQVPTLPEEGIEGTALFSPYHLSRTPNHFGSSWLYQGKLIAFIPASDTTPIARNLSCSLYLPVQKRVQRPLATSSYIIKGRLKAGPTSNVTLHLDKKEPWLPISNSWSGAEWRFSWKQRLRLFFSKKIPDPLSREFLAGIATGGFEEQLLSHHFSRFGLQHIMAISGFHFSLIAGIVGLLLSLFFKLRVERTLLLILLTLYFFFLGVRPSIFRAWVSATLGICSLFVKRKSSALNSLGVALFALLLFDPTQVYHLGLQFTMLATAAILLLFQPIERLLQRLITPKPLETVSLMRMCDQHGYLILSYFRQALALTLAVTLATAPLVLYTFHSFPLLSLLYNLFFPFMVSVAMVLLATSMLVSICLPGVGKILFTCTSLFTRFCLNFTINAPPAFDLTFRTDALPESAIILYLCALFGLGICAQSRRVESRLFWF